MCFFFKGLILVASPKLCYWLMTIALNSPVDFCVFFKPGGERVGWQVTGRSRCQHLEVQLVEQTPNLKNNGMLLDSSVVFSQIMRVLT